MVVKSKYIHISAHLYLFINDCKSRFSKFWKGHCSPRHTYSHTVTTWAEADRRHAKHLCESANWLLGNDTTLMVNSSDSIDYSIPLRMLTRARSRCCYQRRIFRNLFHLFCIISHVHTKRFWSSSFVCFFLFPIVFFTSVFFSSLNLIGFAIKWTIDFDIVASVTYIWENLNCK